MKKVAIIENVRHYATWIMSKIHYRIPFIICLILFYLTTFGDSISFELAGDYGLNPFYYAVKVLVLVTFLVLSQLIPMLYYKAKSGNLYVQRFVKYFLIYAAILFAVWLLIYPGNFTGVDEAYVVGGARTLNIYFAWHHVLAVVGYAFALGFFPSLATITFIELIVISAIVAYVMTQFHKLIGNNRAQALFFVFLLPSVIILSLVPLRLSVYAFLEMLLFFLIVKAFLGKEKLSFRFMIALGTLCGLVASLRTESIVFVVLIPMVLAILFGIKQTSDKKKIAAFAISSVICLFGVNVLQNLNHNDSVKYQVTGMMEPLSSMLSGGDYKYANKAEAKKIVDKAIDYDRLVSGENANVVYWSRAERNLSEEDLSELKSLTIRLALENPVKFIKGCAKNFLKSNSLWHNLQRDGVQPQMDFRFTENLIAYRPVSDQIRNTTLNIFNATSYDFTHYTPMIRVLYNAALVGGALLVLMIYMITKREILVLILIPLLVKNLIIFISAPLPSFYYYFPLQLTGLVIIVMYVVFGRRSQVLVSHEERSGVKA